jgi:hypothetical protein
VLSWNSRDEESDDMIAILKKRINKELKGGANIEEVRCGIVYAIMSLW